MIGESFRHDQISNIDICHDLRGRKNWMRKVASNRYCSNGGSPLNTSNFLSLVNCDTDGNIYTVIQEIDKIQWILGKSHEVSQSLTESHEFSLNVHSIFIILKSFIFICTITIRLKHGFQTYSSYHKEYRNVFGYIIPKLQSRDMLLHGISNTHCTFFYQITW